jgi:hypothetical protein
MLLVVVQALEKITFFSRWAWFYCFPFGAFERQYYC